LPEQASVSFSAGWIDFRSRIRAVGRENRSISCKLPLVRVDLSQGQFNALVSFTFNLGRENLVKSRLLANINSGKPVTKANFTDWNKAGGEVVDGLTRRREDEYNLFVSGRSSRCPN
jgi:GH24 family phage-related lysozyme (muramidase)